MGICVLELSGGDTRQGEGTRRREGATREETEVEKKPRRFHLRSSKK
jgi:hypothetical protein